ncbi:MAG TPA: FIST N-terminal domain-containing protein [Longimicrobiales bacterium]|nr:FIST N-terminal domain-containing protein [Longimicrobiales bacterium]
MTESAVVHTNEDGGAAGKDLAAQIHAKLAGRSPDALIVFASPRNNYEELLHALNDACKPGAMIGCSSAGEFTTETSGEGLTTAVALIAPEMKFSATMGKGISVDREKAVGTMVDRFAAVGDHRFEHKAALVLVDALAGYAEEIIDRLTITTGGKYRFFGGGAGDDARFQNTFVFCGTTVASDAAVALEILSHKPLGIGARHGWQAASEAMRVTETEGTQVKSLNVAPAAEAFAEHALATNQQFDREAPIPFFLHNIVGIKTPSGHKLRVPLGVTEQGGVVCAAEIPTGATTNIMSTVSADAIEAASAATQDAVNQVITSGSQPQVALFFDCVATRLRMGKEFKEELQTVADQLGAVEFAGFNSYGQIVRSEGQFSGFHNCTAVVCVFPA